MTKSQLKITGLKITVKNYWYRSKNYGQAVQAGSLPVLVLVLVPVLVRICFAIYKVQLTFKTVTNRDNCDFELNLTDNVKMIRLEIG